MVPNVWYYDSIIFRYNSYKKKYIRNKKRSRVRNEVNKKKQCRACRADGKQCSRQRKDGEDFCGTHIKGCPHGKYKITEDHKDELKLSIIEYLGIMYYIDLNTRKVYSTEDVLNKKNDPEVIGTYDNDNKVNIKKSYR